MPRHLSLEPVSHCDTRCGCHVCGHSQVTGGVGVTCSIRDAGVSEVKAGTGVTHAVTGTGVRHAVSLERVFSITKDVVSYVKAWGDATYAIVRVIAA